MTDADLSGCRAKVARAKEQLDTLQREVSAYLDARPYGVGLEWKDGISTARMRVETPPSADWGIAFGEIATSARSALDYLVFQLAVDNGARPGRKDRTQFPIFLSEKAYRQGRTKSHRERMLKGVRSRDRRAIDSFQPYQRGRQQAPNDPLAVLREISDREKHRGLHASLVAMTTLTISLREEAQTHYFRAHFDTPEPVADR